MWTKFEVKIQKYRFAANVGSYREDSLKAPYLDRNKLWAQALCRIFIVHLVLHDVPSLG
jgi:hypothetical protein